LKKRKQLLQLLAIRLAAIFADFKAFGGFDGFAFGFAVEGSQLGAVAVGFATAAAEPLIAEPVLAAGDVAGGRDGADVLLTTVGPAFVMLRSQLVNRVNFLIEYVVNGHGDVGLERIRFLKTVAGIHEDRVFLEDRGVGANERHSDHISRVLNENAD